jgi:hypothetical protein
LDPDSPEAREAYWPSGRRKSGPNISGGVRGVAHTSMSRQRGRSFSEERPDEVNGRDKGKRARIVRRHGSLSLEWPRPCPANPLSIGGLPAGSGMRREHADRVHQARTLGLSLTVSERGANMAHYCWLLADRDQPMMRMAAEMPRSMRYRDE